MKKHIVIGISAALLLLLVYVGIISLAESLEHALDQASQMWYWVAALAGGFGVQAGLFSFIRQGIRERRAVTATSVGTSGGVSAGSMVACCAHHLSDVLPLLGLSGLAVFLVDYQLVFIIAGVLSNIVGITIMLETIQRHSLSQRVGRWKWNMRRVKRGTMISAGLIFVFTFFLNFFTSIGS